MVLTFEAYDPKTEGDATVTISLDELGLIRFDVLLYGLPENLEVGHEVTVNFFDLAGENTTFWTDSNGLGMQKRELNHRDYWDIQI